jgi:hypothetical protein
MTSVYRLTDLHQILKPDDILEWLDSNIGTLLKKSETLMDSDVPADGINWRIVKLFQRIGNGSYQCSIFIEFENATDLIYFKLVWG